MSRYSRRSFLDASLAGATGLLLGPAARAGAGTPVAAPAGAPTEALALLSIREASVALKARKLSPLELTRNCLARIEAFNPALNAFITVTAESALAQAAQAESEIARGSWRGPLHGIPLALKDLIDTAGVRTTSACAVFKDRIPDADAAVVARLRAAGAVLLGKLNMQECAYGGTSVPSYYGRVCNPWDLERITGGSSGGAAAAVAAGLCYGALGSDTGGSVREPAAFCGIVGLKPTYGRVSIRGVMPLAASLDHIGPMTRTVADAAIMLAAIAGYDPADATSVDRPEGSYTVSPGPAGASGARLRIGLPREFFFAELDPEIQAATDQAIGVLRSLGAQFRGVPLEVSTDRTVVRAEAYAAQAEFIVRSPELYLPETLSKLRSGADIDAPGYIRARRALDQHRRSVVQVFSAVDLLLTPTTPVLPIRASDYPATFEGAVALDGSLLRNTRPFNLSGLPTLSMPCGISRAGLPIGLQLSGPPWAEQRVLAVAQAFEQATDWHARRPPRPFTG
jgi:aspartyl-tRNA(Asn)/glutamyl-tRNA(Gln) amidotransferase subunit A